MVSFGDSVELYAWKIMAACEPGVYVVVAATAPEALRCFRAGWNHKWQGREEPPEVTQIKRMGKYLWPR